MSTGFYQFFIDLVTTLARTIGNIIVEIINAILSAFGTWIGSLIDMLPTSTLSLPSNESSYNVGQVMGYANWFFPFDVLILCVTAYFVFWVVYQTIRPFLKFTQTL